MNAEVDSNHERAMNAASDGRILMLLENLPFPQDVRVRREANALVNAGYRVTVICPAAEGQPLREIVNGVHVRRYPAPRPANSFTGYVWEYGYSMAASFALSLLVFLQEGFDVVHAHNPPDTFVFIGGFYKLLFGKRFVYDHHDLSPEMYRVRFPNGGKRLVYEVLVLLEQLTCRFADHVLVTNESYRKLAMERGRVPENRITVVRNGIELERVEASVAPHPAFRQLGKTIIGYVGVMGHQDGVDHLLRVIYHLVYDLGRTDFHCVLIGGGDAWESLRTLAQSLGLSEYVQFTGFVFGEGLLRYLAAADICVDATPSNPYSDRSTLFKIIEYMSLGKAIVTFDLPEHRFTAGDAAVYVAPNDELDFAKAVAELMDDPQRRKSLGALARIRMKKHLAWEYSALRLINAYHQIMPSSSSHQVTVEDADVVPFEQ
jgi:glycosyltransferase involved in cell wall biosynthesis